MHWYLRAFKKYATFRGRAQRAEFWWFSFFYWAIAFIPLFLAAMVGAILNVDSDTVSTWFSLAFVVYWLASIVPVTALYVRRLHDLGRTGWWALLTYVPFISIVFFILLCCLPGQQGANTYGDDPRAADDNEAEIVGPLHERMRDFMRVASRLFAKNTTMLLALYFTFLAIPVIFNAILVYQQLPDTVAAAKDPSATFGTGMWQVITSFFQPIKAGSDDYLSWAFSSMFEALVVPFACAAIVVATLDLIDAGRIRFLECCRRVLSRWLTLAQFGILWFIALAIVRAGMYTFIGVVPYLAPAWLKYAVVGGFLIALVLGYALQSLAFMAALVSIVVNDIDPLRAAGFGLWFGMRYVHKLTIMAGILGRDVRPLIRHDGVAIQRHEIGAYGIDARCGLSDYDLSVYFVHLSAAGACVRRASELCGLSEVVTSDRFGRVVPGRLRGDMAKKESWDTLWAAERGVLYERLKEQAVLTRGIDRRVSEQHRLAARTLLGWLPLVIIIFWTTFILSKAVTFTRNDQPPSFAVAAYGKRDDLIVRFQGSPRAVDLEILIPSSISRVVVGNVSGGTACRWSRIDGQAAPIPASASAFSYADMMSDTGGDVTGRSVAITFPGTAYEEAPLYGRETPFVSVICHTEWQPLRVDSTSYAMVIVNDDVTSAHRPAGTTQLPVDVYSPETEDVVSPRSREGSRKAKITELPLQTISSPWIGNLLGTLRLGTSS